MKHINIKINTSILYPPFNKTICTKRLCSRMQTSFVNYALAAVQNE